MRINYLFGVEFSRYFWAGKWRWRKGSEGLGAAAGGGGEGGGNLHEKASVQDRGGIICRRGEDFLGGLFAGEGFELVEGARPV